MAEDSTANVQQSDLFEVKDGVLFYGESPAEYQLIQDYTMPLRVDFSEQADRQIKQETELDSTLPLEQDYGATKPTTKEFYNYETEYTSNKLSKVRKQVRQRVKKSKSGDSPIVNSPNIFPYCIGNLRYLMEINYTRHSLKMLKKKRNQASRDEDSQKELRFTYFLADYLLKGKKKVGTANRLTETIRGKLNATDYDFFYRSLKLIYQAAKEGVLEAIYVLKVYKQKMEMHKVDNEFERKMVADYLQRKAAKIPNEAMDSVANQESNNANL